GAADGLTITAIDNYGNTITGYTGDKTLTFSGPSAAPFGNTPTITDKTASAIAVGTSETLTFTNGVATAGGSLKLYRVEPVNLLVTDGTIVQTTPLSLTP